MTSLEPHNLTLAATHSLLQYNASSKLGDDDGGDPWGPSSSPPPFFTPEVPEDPVMHHCGLNIMDMNFTAYEYPHRTDTWVPFTWREVLKVVAYVILFLMSLTGNLLVILVVCYNTKLRTSTNQYLVNLTVADLLVTLVCMWVHIVRHLSYPNYILPAFVCKLDGFIQETSLLASVLTLTVISVGRFVAVMFPIHSHTSPNHDHRVIAAVWAVSALISCPTLFYRELYSTEWSNFTSWNCEEFWPTKSQYNPETRACVVVYDAKKYFYTVLTIVLYFLPIAIMFVTYSLVVWTRWMNQQPGELSGPSKNAAVRWNILKMVLVVLLVFVLCWTPLQTLILYNNFFHAQHMHDLPEWFPTMEFVAYFLAFSNSALNPIIYWGFSASFREGLVSLITCGRTANFSNHYPRRWRGAITGDTRDSTLPYSGPEPVVILEISSLRGTARWCSFQQKCIWEDQQQQQQPCLNSTSSLAINPASLKQRPECSELDLGQNGSRMNSVVSHPSIIQLTSMGQNESKGSCLVPHCSRKLSSLSTSSSSEGGDGCLSYQGKRRRNTKDVSLHQKIQICEELRENLAHETREEKV